MRTTPIPTPVRRESGDNRRLRRTREFLTNGRRGSGENPQVAACINHLRAELPVDNPPVVIRATEIPAILRPYCTPYQSS